MGQRMGWVFFFFSLKVEQIILFIYLKVFLILIKGDLIFFQGKQIKKINYYIYIYTYIFFFFSSGCSQEHFKFNLASPLPAARTLSPLNSQTLCAWRGAKSATKPLASIVLCENAILSMFVSSYQKRNYHLFELMFNGFNVRFYVKMQL